MPLFICAFRACKNSFIYLYFNYNFLIQFNMISTFLIKSYRGCIHSYCYWLSWYSHLQLRNIVSLDLSISLVLEYRHIWLIMACTIYCMIRVYFYNLLKIKIYYRFEEILHIYSEVIPSYAAYSNTAVWEPPLHLLSPNYY